MLIYVICYIKDKEFPDGICVVLIPGNLSLSHCAINSAPGSSLAMWPINISESCLPLALASRTYSAVSHSDISPHNITSGCILLMAVIWFVPPAAPGNNNIFLQTWLRLPT